jgi:hypothetical protein
LQNGLRKFEWLSETKPATNEDLFMQTLIMGYAFPLNPEIQMGVWQAQGEPETDDSHPLHPGTGMNSTGFAYAIGAAYMYREMPLGAKHSPVIKRRR